MPSAWTAEAAAHVCGDSIMVLGKPTSHYRSVVVLAKRSVPATRGCPTSPMQQKKIIVVLDRMHVCDFVGDSRNRAIRQSSCFSASRKPISNVRVAHLFIEKCEMSRTCAASIPLPSQDSDKYSIAPIWIKLYNVVSADMLIPVSLFAG